MAKPTLKDRIKRHRSGQVLTPLIDEFFRTASVNGGVQFSPRTMEILTGLFLKPERDRSGSFSASGLAGCMRAQILGYNGEEADLVPSERREAIFFNGHWLHLKWDGILLELGVVRHGAQPRPDLELPVELPSLNLKGTLDAICLLPGQRSQFGLGHDDEWIVDVKGVNPNSYAKITHGDVPRGYVWQQHAYMLATGISRAMLLVENKATGEYTEVHLPPPDSQTYVQMQARLKALNHHLEQETLPAKLPDFPTNPECGDCPFRIVCPTAKFRWGKSIDV